MRKIYSKSGVSQSFPEACEWALIRAGWQPRDNAAKSDIDGFREGQFMKLINLAESENDADKQLELYKAAGKIKKSKLVTRRINKILKSKENENSKKSKNEPSQQS